MREEIGKEHGWSKQKGEEPQRRAKGEALCGNVLRGLRSFDVVHVYVLIANCQFNSIHLLLIPN